MPSAGGIGGSSSGKTKRRGLDDVKSSIDIPHALLDTATREAQYLLPAQLRMDDEDAFRLDRLKQL